MKLKVGDKAVLNPAKGYSLCNEILTVTKVEWFFGRHIYVSCQNGSIYHAHESHFLPAPKVIKCYCLKTTHPEFEDQTVDVIYETVQELLDVIGDHLSLADSGERFKFKIKVKEYTSAELEKLPDANDL